MQLALLFLKLGVTGFGGPFALIGMMEQECVHRRKWLDAVTFHQFVAVAKLFPGPIASLVAIRIGFHRSGWKGGVTAGTCIILPAFLMMIFFASVVKRLETFSFLNPLWIGLSLAALAVAFYATYNLSKPLYQKKDLSPALTSIVLLSVASLTFFCPHYEIAFLVGAGLLGLLMQKLSRSKLLEAGSLVFAVILFFGCARASLFTFGSGIAIVPVLRSIFIDEHHWITSQDFLKGLTFAQITPGPLVILSTYLGYVAFGFLGSVAAALGTFLPTFFLGIFAMPALENKMLNSQTLKSFFKWLLPAVCGAILGSLLRLMSFTVVVDGQFQIPRFALILILTLILIRTKMRAEWTFLIGGLAAYLILGTLFHALF